MHKKVLAGIEKLNGSYQPPEHGSVANNIDGIKFTTLLFDKNWDGYGLDTFLKKNRDLYADNCDLFYDLLLEQYFEDNERPRGQTFWRARPFTPMTKGTADHKEWGEVFTDPDMVDLSPIREFAGEGTLEFHQIIYAYGYPDHYYVCLQDPNPEDPTIIGTDHEVFFKEHYLTPMSEFLDRYLTAAEFRAIAEECIDDLLA